jgi:hypothetical protein
MDDSYIQEQHFRINNALSKFEPGSTNAMWAIIQGLYLINGHKLDTEKTIPHTQITTKDIDVACECEYYIAFTMKNSAFINTKIVARSQMFSTISFVKSELYKTYSKYVSEHYGNRGITYTSSGNYLGGK